MTENEMAVIHMIRDSKDPVKAMQIALEILTSLMAEEVDA